MAVTKNNFLGELLLEKGVITKKQLDEALEKQKTTQKTGSRGLLGQALVDLGYCTSDDISRAIANKAGVEFLTSDQYEVDMAAANLITPGLAKKYKALPIGFSNGSLLLAMKNPGDIIAIDDLKIITGQNIKPVVINDRELDEVLKRFENMSMVMDMAEEIEEEEDEIDFDEDKSDVNERPAVQLANQIINQAVKSAASDVHVEPQEKKIRIRYRIDGVLHEIMQYPSNMLATLVSRIKVMANMDIAERRIPQDGRITLKIEGNVYDVRVASMPTAYGEKLTMRLLNRSDKVITLKELGFNQGELDKYSRVTASPYGFILITGPTGSGKSTTLYATLAKLNQVDRNIITVEDPIERRLDGLNQTQVNARAGMTFVSGLRAILRSDPDIIMVGEIRDHETARIAVESALTGHLVLSTMHTNDSAGAISRLADMGIEPYLSAAALVGVVAQRLMRLLCTNCKEKYVALRDVILKSAPDFPFKDGEEKIELFKPKGCLFCNGTGYKGRVGIYEFLQIDEDMQRLMLSKASTGEIHEEAVKKGMLTMRQDGLDKVRQGLTSVEEVLRVIV